MAGNDYFDHVSRDGTRFDARMYVSPLIDSRGQRTGWMTSMTNITEAKRIRDQLTAMGVVLEDDFCLQDNYIPALETAVERRNEADRAEEELAARIQELGADRSRIVGEFGPHKARAATTGGM